MLRFPIAPLEGYLPFALVEVELENNHPMFEGQRNFENHCTTSSAIV
jgi:hypothetical protein